MQRFGDFNPNSLWRHAEISDNRFHASAFFWEISPPPSLLMVRLLENFLCLAAGRFGCLTARTDTHGGGVLSEAVVD